MGFGGSPTWVVSAAFVDGPVCPNSAKLNLEFILPMEKELEVPSPSTDSESFSRKLVASFPLTRVWHQ